MQLAAVVETWETLRSTTSRRAKTKTLGELLGASELADISLVVSYLSGELPQGRIGMGYAAVGSVEATAADSTSLHVRDLDVAFTEIKEISGSGSKAAKASRLTELYERATATEQGFLTSLLLGGLRQGALESLMSDAVAQATDIEAPLVRRAAMVTGDLAHVATAAFGGGATALEEFGLAIFTAVQPMLAQSAENVGAALAKTGEAGIEWKVDGARVQVHRHGDQVQVFTRNLRDITDSVPGIVGAVLALDVESIILDGEAVHLGPAGTPAAFQDTMSRLSADGDGSLDVVFFDCLHLNGRDLIDLPGVQRWEAMTNALPSKLCIQRKVTGRESEAQAFLDEAIASGHEGVMVKALDAAYAAGRRGAAWVKVKPVYTLDLVVLAIEWGSGRRQGWLSNIHLGAQNPEASSDDDQFVMLGKTFKGMTDKILAWQTERFLELETHREGHIVFVRPEQVVEIAVDGIQRSSRYPGGVALRFARVRRYRDDKPATEADTIATVRSLG